MNINKGHVSLPVLLGLNAAFVTVGHKILKHSKRNFALETQFSRGSFHM